MMIMNHCCAWFYRSLQLFIPKNLNSQLLAFANFNTQLRDPVLCFLNCGARKSFVGHSGHIQGKAYVRLF